MSGNAALDAVHAYLDALLEEAPAAACVPAAATEHAMPPARAPMRAAAAAAIAPPGAPDPMHAHTGSFAHATARARAPSLLQPQRWVRVVVGRDSYALELLCVQEVVRLAPIVAMRGAAAAVLGAMNLRGRIVPVFDLGLWLGAGRVQPDERSRIVVVERDDELIGVLVGAVEDVVTLGQDRIEPPLAGADPGCTLGVARVGAVPTVLLDANALYGG